MSKGSDQPDRTPGPGPGPDLAEGDPVGLQRGARAWRDFIESLPDNYLEIDRAGRILYITKLDPGITPGSIAEATIFDFIPSHRHVEMAARLERVWTTRMAEPYSIEALQPDGMHYYRARVGPVEEAGEVVRLAIISLEVTSEKRAAQSLAELETRFQAFLDHSPSVVYLKGTDLRFLLVNNRFLQLKGFTLDQVVGSTDRELFGPEAAAGFNENDRAVMDRGEPMTFEELLTIDGVTAIYLSNKFPVFDGDGALIAVGGVSTDMTERLRLERQVRNSQKMAAIGQLAGGLAHDFNNLFVGILGNAELLVEGLRSSASPTLLTHAQAISETTRRATELTTKLLAFSRRSILRSQVLDVHALLEEVASLLTHSVGPDIRIRCRLAATEAAVFAEPAQLQNALLNLAVNARDAMPDGGELAFETENEEVPAEAARDLEVKPGTYLKLSVRDTGVGIEPELLERVFEPFFTTKDIGAGSGLGLPAVHGTLRAHGGAYRLYSAVGSGTTFVAYLPLAPAAAMPAREDGPPILGEGRVLLVEDDAMARTVARAFLRRLGYGYVEAHNGREAIDLLAGGGEPVDVVLLDLLMPEVDGAAVLRWLREEAPDLPVVLTSGVAPEQELSPELVQHCRSFLPKPFTLAAFSRALAEAMGRSDV